MPTSTIPDAVRALEAATSLLESPISRREKGVEADLRNLIQAYHLQPEIGHPVPDTDREADLFIPELRLVIEAKRVGQADVPEGDLATRTGEDETPLEQLEDYVHHLIAHDRSLLAFDGGRLDRSWTGIVTDGHVWHAWEWTHSDRPRRTRLFLDRRARSPDELIRIVEPFLTGAIIGKPWIPDDPRPIVKDDLAELHTIYRELPQRASRETQTKTSLWLDMLRVSNMEPAEQARSHLFVVHSFLVALARGVIHTLTHPEADPDPQRILGDGFVAWIIQTTPGRAWANNFLGTIHSYEWRKRQGDVLRPLYEAFVEPRDRKVFGEFYTPDWLAELIVSEVLDDAWCARAASQALQSIRRNRELRRTGVLDPACGSGTFLYHAAKRLRASPAISKLARPRQAAVITHLVQGIDIHPVAIEIARATLLRALPAPPPDGHASLHIYQGDSLLMQRDLKSTNTLSLFWKAKGTVRIETPQRSEILLPHSFASQPNFHEDLRRMVELAQDVAEPQLDADIVTSVPARDRPALQECYATFRSVIAAEGNSVWTWYLSNITGPYRISEAKIDRIVANPPWVRMAEIQDVTRKRTMEDFADKILEIWTGGKQAPHFDIASLFLKRTRELYLHKPATNPAGWLVKKAAMRAGSWQAFREWREPIAGQTFDLEAVQPFGGGDARRPCILLDQISATRVGGEAPTINVGIAPGAPRPSQSNTLRDAMPSLRFVGAPASLPVAQSGYVGLNQRPLVRQGASILPQVLCHIASIAPAGAERSVTITTARSSKRPWNSVPPQRGTIPGHWVQSLLRSNELLPFAFSTPAPRVIIPTSSIGGLHADPASDAQFWDELEGVWQEYRPTGNRSPETLLQQLDYNDKLSRQLPLPETEARTQVMHPKSGDIMRGVRVCPGTAIADSSTYRYNAQTPEEAAYLVALLNARALREAFSQSRRSGRDFHAHPWMRIPIPKFDPGNQHHLRLAALTEQAEDVVASWLDENLPNPPARIPSQPALSRRIRGALQAAGIMSAIDAEARRVLPDHTTATDATQLFDQPE